MEITLTIMFIILAFAIGIYIGAVANINNLNKRMDELEITLETVFAEDEYEEEDE